MLNVKKKERKQEGGDIGGKDFKKEKKEKCILKGKVNDSGAYKHLKISTITDTSQKKGIFYTKVFTWLLFSYIILQQLKKNKNNFGWTNRN